MRPYCSTAKAVDKFIDDRDTYGLDKPIKEVIIFI